MYIISNDVPNKARQLSGRNKADCSKTLGIFWGGEWGYLSMNVAPRINAMRAANPDLYIIVAGFADDYIYFRDNNGDWTVDEYIGYDFWPINRCQHVIKGQLSYEARGTVDYLYANCDEVWETQHWTTAKFEAEFNEKKQIAYAFKTLIADEPRVDEGNYIVVFARAKNYTLCRLRSWNRPAWEKFFELMLPHELPDTKIYVCGVDKESILFDWNDQIIPVLSGADRSTKTLNLVANAMYCISDCSGSAHYSMLTGTPTFVSGTPDYHLRYVNERNYFGVYLHYQDAIMSNLTAEQRFEGWKQFKADLHYNLEREVYVYPTSN